MNSREQSTLVIIYPEDHNGAFRNLSSYIESLRAAGGRVHVIGDGQRVLSLQEIRDGLREVEGPATLYVAAHGIAENGGNHRIGGVQYGLSLPSRIEFLDDRFNEDTLISSAELFTAIPENYRTVIMGSCYSEAANNDAVRYLPSGTVFLPTAADEFVGYGSVPTEINNTTSPLVNPLYASDFYLTTMLYNQRPRGRGYVETSVDGVYRDQLSKQAATVNLSTATVERITIQRQNVPDSVAVGQRGTFNIGNYINQFRGYEFSEGQLLQINERLSHLLNDEVWPERAELQAGTEADAALAQTLPHIRRIAERMTQGDISPGDPEYSQAYAIAFAMAEFHSPYFDAARAQPLVAAPLSDAYDPNFGVIHTNTAGQQEVLESKYERELSGLALDLQAGNFVGIRFDDGRSKLDVDGNGVIGVEDLRAVMRQIGVVRSEQIGNHDREITMSEFLERAGGEELANVPFRPATDRERH